MGNTSIQKKGHGTKKVGDWKGKAAKGPNDELTQYFQGKTGPKAKKKNTFRTKLVVGSCWELKNREVLCDVGVP